MSFCRLSRPMPTHEASCTPYYCLSFQGGATAVQKFFARHLCAKTKKTNEGKRDKQEERKPGDTKRQCKQVNETKDMQFLADLACQPLFLLRRRAERGELGPGPRRSQNLWLYSCFRGQVNVKCQSLPQHRPLRGLPKSNLLRAVQDDADRIGVLGKSSWSYIVGRGGESESADQKRTATTT